MFYGDQKTVQILYVKTKISMKAPDLKTGYDWLERMGLFIFERRFVPFLSTNI
jgi:hypothetical protein